MSWNLNVALRVAILQSPYRTQAALAQALTMREERLSRIVNRRVIPSGYERRMLAAALGTTVQALEFVHGQND